MNCAQVAIYGEALFDFVEHDSSQFLATPGGSPFNVAVALAKLDIPVAFLGRLSSDRFGRTLRSKLLGSGPAECVPETSGKPTDIAIVRVNDGNPGYSFYLSCVEDSDEELKAVISRWPDQASVFHTGSFALLPERMEVTLGLIAHAKSRGLLISVDLNMRSIAANDLVSYRQCVREAAGLADILKFSADDLAELHPNLDRQFAIRKLSSEADPEVMVMTSAEHGVTTWYRSGEVFTEPALSPKRIADAIGCGDCFQAAFLASLIASPTPHRRSTHAVTEAIRFAQTAAILNLERVGCCPPTSEEINARYGQEWTSG